MILYPAIDMLDGQAVRLRQGKREDVTVYGDPVELARKWRGKGADAVLRKSDRKPVGSARDLNIKRKK